MNQPPAEIQQYLEYEQTGQQIQAEFLEFLREQEEIYEDKTTKEQIIRKKYEAQARIMIEEQTKTLEVDANDIQMKFDAIFQEIFTRFYHYESYLQKAVSEFVLSIKKNMHFRDEIEEINQENEQYYISIFNFTQNHNKIRKLKMKNLGELTKITGTVTRSTDVRPELISAAFQCMMCNTIVKGIKQEFQFTEPLFCTGHNCKNTNQWQLQPQYSSFSDMQKLRVQELSADIPPGGMPRSFDIILRDQVCDRVKPGDSVNITGYLIAVPEIQSLSKPGEMKMVVSKGDGIKSQNSQTTDGMMGLKKLGQRDLNHRTAFIGNSISRVVDSLKQNNTQMQEIDEDKEDISLEKISTMFTSAEMMKIKDIAENPNVYKNLAQSITPAVSGSEEIKKGLLLMLCGGVHKQTHEGINLRGDLNLCIVGDPSTAKTQFLRYVANFLPRSVYTSGKASSAAGLTASVQRDPETGEYCVEAGALMLADHGVCCIDEFDKMGAGDQVAIHEAMEQQTISIAKAGIQATLNARASILAAANPIFGRYDKSKTLRQNLEMSDAIMSRFDLFFILLDEQDQVGDKTIANYILKLHQKGEDALRDNYVYKKEDIQLYLSFIKHIKPHFTKEAAQELEQSYIKLRMNDLSCQKAAYQTTVRQLESLIRLSEALARVHANMQIEVSYVKEACKLLSNSIIKIEKENMEFVEQEEVQHDIKEQKLITDVQQRQQDEEKRQQNKIKLTYEEYTRMMQDFVQWFKEQQMQMDKYNEEHQDEEPKYGIQQQNAVEEYITRHLQDLQDDSEEAITLLIRTCHAVIQKMVSQENILVIIQDSRDYKDRLLAIHENFVEI